MKKVLKFFGALVALLLSFVLVTFLFLIPVVSFTTSTLEPANLVKIVMTLRKEKPQASRPPILLADGPIGNPSENALGDLSGMLGSLEGVDLSALEDALQTIAESNVIDFEKVATDLGLEGNIQIDGDQLMKDIVESEMATTIISTYLEDVTDAALGIDGPPALTAETIVELVKPHVDEVAEIINKQLPEEKKVEPKKLKETVTEVLEVSLPTLVETLPPAEVVAEQIVPQDNKDFNEILEALKAIRTGKLLTAVIVAAAVLAVLIFLCRLPSFKGLRQVGICALFGGLVAGGIGYALQMKEILNMVTAAAAEASTLVINLLGDLAGVFVNCAIIYAIAGVVLVVGASVLKAVFARK